MRKSPLVVRKPRTYECELPVVIISFDYMYIYIYIYIP